VVIGETGSGKTTQIPQYLREAGWASAGRSVVCTQPRRLAVTAVAERVAAEVGCELGHEVGYSIRFQDVSTDGLTTLRFVTDGVLLQELSSDPLLERYSVVVVDEAHERSSGTDLLLGLLRRVQRRRPDLRVVVSSATIEAERFAEFFEHPWRPGKPPAGWEGEGGGGGGGGAGDGARKASRWAPESDADRAKRWHVSGKPAVISVEGRLHDVEVHYLREPTSDYVRAAVEAAVAVHGAGVPGDVLVFLTGQEECERAVGLLREAAGEARGGRGLRLRALPLFAGLPAAAQAECLAPARRGERRVIVATNVAETSITIEGVVHVVDSCLVKQRVFDPVSGLESLAVAPCSHQSARQRAGRAGRVRPGHCFRLCTEEDFLRLPAADVPEIQRSDLSGAVLRLKSLGVDNLVRFPWLSAPPAEAMVRALETLFVLGALDEGTALTRPAGVRMSELPVAPMLARCLLWASEHGCPREMATCAATLGVPSIWAPGGNRLQDEAKSRFWVAEGDLVTALNVWEAWDRAGRRAQFAARVGVHQKGLLRASDIRAQILRHMERLGMSTASDGDASADDVCRGVAAGFFANAAVLQPEGAPHGADGAGPSYRMVRGGGGSAGPGGSYRPPPVLRLHRSSVLSGCLPQWVVFASAAQTVGGVYEMQGVTAIESSWLTELAPHYFEVRGVRPGA